jgi:hypothetical protein
MACACPLASGVSARTQRRTRQRLEGPPSLSSSLVSVGSPAVLTLFLWEQVYHDSCGSATQPYTAKLASNGEAAQNHRGVLKRQLPKKRSLTWLSRPCAFSPEAVGPFTSSSAVFVMFFRPCSFQEDVMSVWREAQVLSSTRATPRWREAGLRGRALVDLWRFCRRWQGRGVVSRPSSLVPVSARRFDCF